MLKLTVDVYHNLAVDAAGRSIGFVDGYEPGHPLLRVFRYETETETAMVPTTVPTTVCEEAFRLFNVGDDPDYGEPDSRAVEYRSRNNRSLSVGDVVAFAGYFFACARHGFAQLDARPMILDLYGSTPISCKAECAAVVRGDRA